MMINFWFFAIIFGTLFLLGKAIWQDFESFITWGKLMIKKQWETWGKWVWEKRLRIIYVIFASVILYYLFELFLKLRFQLFVDITNLKDNDVRNLALAFLGTISGLGALFGVYLAILRSETTERQTQTAEQGLITDRINKATEGLGKNNEKGKPVVEVRLGSLYALERIAQDSLRDHVQIMEILCAYVRHNSPLKNKNSKEKKPREDIQAALTIIGRRGEWPNGDKYLKAEEEQRYQIDLSQCSLYEAELNEAELCDAWLIGTNMRDTDLINADMADAVLKYADMSGAWIKDADISRANFEKVTMQGTETERAYAHEGDFSNCRYLTQKQLNKMFCGFDVVINKVGKPPKFKKPKHWPKKRLSYDDFMKEYDKWLEKAYPELVKG